jgi:hypothetical protein
VGSGFSPLDRQLALRDKHCSKGLARLAVWLGGRLPYAQAAEVLAEAGRVVVSETTVWRLVQQWGGQFQTLEKREQVQAQAIPSAPPAGEKLPDRLGVAADGAMVYVRQEGWKELKVGCVFAIEPHRVKDPVTKEQVEVGHAVENHYVGHLGEPEVFGEKLWAAAQQRRWSAVRETEAVGDGAAWIWNLVDEHFGQSLQVIDWFHAMEHLAQAANLAFGEGTMAAKRWRKKQETVLYQGDAARIAQRIARLAERRQEGKEALQKEAAYFEHNKRRMDYLELRAAGWPIGSGMVESGGKQFKTRLTGPGMQWSRGGAERLIPVRAALLSHRFDARWQTVYNSPPI